MCVSCGEGQWLQGQAKNPGRRKERGYPSPGGMIVPQRLGRVVVSTCGEIMSLLGDTPVVWFPLMRTLQATLLRKAQEI